MSHFSVLVRVPHDVTHGAIKTAVGGLLLPFKESGCGDTDPPELARLLVFEDTEDQDREDYETGSASVFIDPAGVPHSKYGDQFRRWYRASFTTEYICPAGWTVDEHYPKAKMWPTFEEYQLDYCGMKRDERTGRYGRWHNPHQKWDWFEIGGRWSNDIFARSGPANFARICEIDWDRMESEAGAVFETWADSYLGLADGTDKSHPFEGPRARALELDLVQCKNADELTEEERNPVRYALKKWDRELTPGVARYDVIRILSRPELEQYRVAFMPGFAFLDANGWHENGEMGWFGMSHGGSGTGLLDFKRATYDAIRNTGNETDWLVVVDCHI